MRDPEKTKARQRRYRDRQKAEKFGAASVGVDMRGRHGNHARGQSNARWNDGRMLNEDGYVKVRVGRDHPLADPNGYAYEHLVVWYDDLVSLAAARDAAEARLREAVPSLSEPVEP